MESTYGRASWPELLGDIVACRRCPRLVAHREQVPGTRRAYRTDTYWARPVPGFGDPRARIVLVGLAPAAHGANRTGRMFTGDRSGDFLMASLHRLGLASQPTSVTRDDGLMISQVWITAVVRCAPPDNRPQPEEIQACLPYLARESQLLPTARVYVCLGHIAWDRLRALLRASGAPVAPVPFAHGATMPLPSPWPTVMASYHPSQQNTFTGRLTPAMLDTVLARAALLAGVSGRQDPGRACPPS